MNNKRCCEHWMLRQVRLFLVGFVFVVIGACMFMPLKQPTLAPPQATPKRIVPRTMGDPRSGFSEQWRTQLRVNLGDGSAARISSDALVVTNEALFVVAAQSASSDPLKAWQIVALDRVSGNQMWISDNFGYPHSLAIGPNALFIATSFSIDAYDAQNGQRLWTSDQTPPDHESFSLFYDSERRWCMNP